MVVGSMFLTVAPAQAATCSNTPPITEEDVSLEDACRVAAQVICGVVAKGRSCLM